MKKTSNALSLPMCTCVDECTSKHPQLIPQGICPVLLMPNAALDCYAGCRSELMLQTGLPLVLCCIECYAGTSSSKHTLWFGGNQGVGPAGVAVIAVASLIAISAIILTHWHIQRKHKLKGRSLQVRHPVPECLWDRHKPSACIICC